MARIDIDLKAQSARLLNGDGNVITQYEIAGSRHGPGERNGSFCTRAVAMSSAPG